MTESANGMKPDDPSRMHFCGWVTIEYNNHPVLKGMPRYVIHDTGSRLWMQADHAEVDGLPISALLVHEEGDSAYNIDGGCIISVPVEWCTFIDEDTAEQIFKCAEVDETLRGYMN